MNLITLLFSLFAFSLPISKNIANGIMIISLFSSIWMFIKYKENDNFCMIFEQPVIKCVILFLGSILVTIPFSSNVLISLREYYYNIGDIAPLFVLILLKIIKDRYTVNVFSIIHAFFIGVLVACLYAIYQASITQQLGVSGFFGNRIYFGFMLEVAIPLVLSLSIITNSVKKRSIYGMLFVLYTTTALLTQARGSWLGIFIGISTVIYIYRKKVTRKVGMLALISILIFGTITTPFYLERAKTIINTDHRTNLQRIQIWQSALYMIRDYPAVGIGIGQFEKKYPEYIDPVESLIRKTPHAHNSYLMIFAEAGVIGFLAFIYLLLSLSKMLAHILRRVDHTGIASGFVGIFCAVLITSFVDNAFFSAYIGKFFWLLLGILLYSTDEGTGNCGQVKF